MNNFKSSYPFHKEKHNLLVDMYSFNIHVHVMCSQTVSNHCCSYYLPLLNVYVVLFVSVAFSMKSICQGNISFAEQTAEIKTEGPLED